MSTIADIINRCGGIEAIRKAIGTTDWAVRKWPSNGIPEKHWAVLRSLGAVTADELHRVNEGIRASEHSHPSEAA